MVLIAGLDDAGRGPVIGPMVLAGVAIGEEDLPNLKNLGVKDSKLLTAQQREQLYEKILKLVKRYKIIKVSPAEIDEAVLSDNTNLNWLEAIKFADIINTLKPAKAIVDCPSPNIPAYSAYLKEHLKVDVELICRHKAESHPAVAAASIIAKVTRDREIEKIKKKYGNCGPGYPSNEITQQFLKENWDKHPEIFRRSWVTWKNHQEAKKQKKLDDYENSGN